MVDIGYQITIVGDAGVGKSLLLSTGTESTHSHGSCINSMTKEYEISGKVHQISFWDTPGCSIYEKHVIRYCAGSAAIIIVYDVTNADSFVRMEDLISDLTKVYGRHPIPFIIVANKTDLPNREITSEQGAKYAASLREGTRYFETSAKTGKGVKELFQALSGGLVMGQVGDIWNSVHLLRKNIRLSKQYLDKNRQAILHKFQFIKQ